MKTSSWQIVALGELQQPGGVGATQDYNPVVDGPNPDAALLDNAGNSQEQEVALETWVNIAVDMMNRGEPVEAIIAKLSHDGCPNPQEILQRAQQQPQQQPVGDSIGQNPFDTPTPDDPSGQMQGLSQQPPTLAHLDIRIEGKDWSKWAAENLPGTDPEGHPVSEIEKFIANYPEVDPVHPELREAAVKIARRAIRGVLSKTTYADAQKLTALDRELEGEQLALRDHIARANFIQEGDYRFFGLNQEPYRYNAFKIVDPDVVPFSGNIKEAALIWASETPYTFDSEEPHYTAAHHDFKFAAYQHGEQLGLGAAQMGEFLRVAEEAVQHRHVRTEEFAAETPDNEGPAEEVFL